MKIAVRYYSKTGNTMKLAAAISEVSGVKMETVDVPLDSDVDILFLGSAVYAAGVDMKIKNFINDLDASKVGQVVNFSTAALLPSTYSQISKLLKAKGISLDAHEFHCRGRFKFMHKDRPNKEDLKDIRAFAERIINK